MRYGRRINRVWGGRNVRFKQLRGGRAGGIRKRRSFRKRRYRRRGTGRIKNLKKPRIIISRKFHNTYVEAFTLGTTGDPIRWKSLVKMCALSQWPDALKESEQWEYYRIMGVKIEWLPWYSQGATVYDYFERPIPATGGADVKYIIYPHYDINQKTPQTPVEMLNRGGHIRTFNRKMQVYVKRPAALTRVWSGTAPATGNNDYSVPRRSPWITTGNPNAVHTAFVLGLFSQKNFAAEPESLTINCFCHITAYIQFKNRKYVPSAVGLADYAALGVQVEEDADNDGDEGAPTVPTAYEPDAPGGGDGLPDHIPAPA